jgi:hypothetical protein
MTPHLKRLLALAAVAVGFLVVVLAGPAVAQVAPDGDVGPDSPVSAYLTVDNTLVLFATGALIPLINGLLLRETNPAWVKALVADVFAVIVHAFSMEIQDDGTAFLSQEWFVGLAITVVGMTAAYLKVWRPIVNVNRRLPTLVPLGDWLARRSARTLPHAA